MRASATSVSTICRKHKKMGPFEFLEACDRTIVQGLRKPFNIMVLISYETFKMKKQVLNFLKSLKAFFLQLKRGKREEISTKTSYCRTIVWSLASRNSKGPNFRLFEFLAM